MAGHQHSSRADETNGLLASDPRSRPVSRPKLMKHCEGTGVWTRPPPRLFHLMSPQYVTSSACTHQCGLAL